jgi:hypothetical protein
VTHLPVASLCRFLDAVVMHITKNFIVDLNGFDKAMRVPLILGIWGGKGQGKSFQTELAFKKLGVEAVVMSGAELENEVAGYPGKMIRERYRKCCCPRRHHLPAASCRLALSSCSLSDE